MTDVTSSPLEDHMKPLEAFQYLYEKKLPLIISFPIEEEKGHFIVGRGLCYIEKIYGTTKIVLSKFSPHRSLSCIRSSGKFQAHFDINAQSYGCCFDDILIDGRKLITEIPANLYPYLRRYLRIEPSAKLPVNLYLFSPQYGTVSPIVQNISEHGAGVLSQSILNVNEHTLCGFTLPFQGGTFILCKATIVSVQEISCSPSMMKMPGEIAGDTMLYGLELFPHPTDANKIRMYIMQREIEIRKLLQEL